MPKFLFWLLNLAIAAILVLAAVPKLLAPGELAFSIWRYDLVPDHVINAAAIILPMFELVLGTATLMRPVRAAAALLAGCLCVGFAVAVGITRWRGLEVACGCFGFAKDAPVSWWHVAFNVGMAAGAFVLAFWAYRQRTVPDGTSTRA